VRLANAGVEIRFSGRLYIHSKTMVFDGAQAFIGSQNPTANSFDNNREVGMVVNDDISLTRCMAVFARDWITGIPATPE
jgi:phosphatidylserine/phosphatidylglycerophosphate/cardiolipin synthase-like enzyme